MQDGKTSASGGVGLNVTQRDAEFGLGPSFQFGSVLLAVGTHIGRYTQKNEHSAERIQPLGDQRIVPA